MHSQWCASQGWVIKDFYLTIKAVYVTVDDSFARHCATLDPMTGVTSVMCEMVHSDKRQSAIRLIDT